MKIYDAATYELPPQGVQPARCFRFIDLGTQSSTYNGAARNVRKILFSFELLAEMQSNGQPFIVSRRFTSTLSEKGELRPFIESWLGRKLQQTDIKSGFDPAIVLGRYGLLNLLESDRDGRQYVNIQSISPLPKGMVAPEHRLDIQLFDLDKPDWSVFESLSQKLQDTIMLSPEYRRAKQNESGQTVTSDESF